MRVLHVTPSFYPAFIYGGPTRSVHQLCLALAGAGCDVRVLTTDANGPDAVLDVATDRETRFAERLNVRYCHRVMDVSVSPTLLRSLTAEVRWADVVHLTAVYSFPTIPTLLAARLYGKPVVWSPRGMLQRWSGSSRPQLKTVWELVCRLAAPERLILHVTSEGEETESRRRLPGVGTQLIPNGIHIPDEVIHVAVEGQLRIVYLGRLDPKKGLENLLAACELLDGGMAPDYSLKIAGDGTPPYVESLRARIRERHRSGRVELVGAVEGKAKRDLFARADLVVVPSHTENFGLVVAEALTHGVPVIASHGTPWRRLEEFGCGLWVDNGPESLAHALTAASAMPLREMGKRGQDWMRREFTWECVGEQMLRLYRQVIGEDGGVAFQAKARPAVTKDA